MKKSLIYIGIVSLLACPAYAERYVEQYGKAKIDIRYFGQEAAYAQQEDSFGTIDLEPGLLIEDDNYVVLLEPRITSGQNGSGRVDLQEAHISTRTSRLDIKIGNSVEFWGKVESFNPVDVLNSYDYTQGLTGGKKLGTNMVKLSAPIGDGQIDAYLLPRFTENIYPGMKSRLRPALLVSDDSALYSGGAKRDDMGHAFRWTSYFGDVDLGLSYISAIGNAPRLVPQIDGSLKPDYSDIQQIGLDIQYLAGDTAYKAEVIDRTGQYNRVGTLQDYHAVVLGVEHSLYGVSGSEYDLVLIGEYAYDSRKKDSHSGFQRDLAGGFRLLFNDVEDSELLVLATHDLDFTSQTLRASYTTRITDGLSVEALVSANAGLSSDLNYSAFDKDTYAGAKLTYSW